MTIANASNASISMEITPEMVDAYAKISGDFNPIHIDEEFAAKGPFGKKVAHGMLVISLIQHSLTSIFGEQWIESGRLRVKMASPIYIGDTITITNTVSDSMGNSDPTASLRFRVTNQRGENVVNGVAACRKSSESVT